MSILSKITGTRSASARPALLAAFWFGIQALWGALLGISLQARTVELNPEHYVIAYGQLAAAGAITASMAQLVIGPISDRIRARGVDRRVFFIIGALLGSIGIFGFYFAHSFALLVGSLMFLQLAVNTAIGPYQAIIPDYLPPARAGIASAWMAALQSLGNAVGALCAVTLSKNPVALSAVLAAMLLCSCAITVRHVRALELRRTEPAPFRLERAAVDLFISRAILWVGFYTVLGYMFFYVQDTLHVRDAVVTSGIVTLLFTVFGVAGAMLSAKPCDVLDRRLVVTVSTGVFIVSLMAFIFLRDVRALFVVAACAGMGWGGFLAADWALGCAILPSAMMATAMGVWNLAVAGPQIIAPVAATTIFLTFHPEKSGAPLFAFGLAALEAAAGTVWIWRLGPSVGKET